MSIEGLEIWISLALSILTLIAILRRDIFYPLLRWGVGSRLNIIEARIEDNNIELLVKNNEKRSVVISRIQLDVEQYFIHGDNAPSFMRMPVSEELNFSIIELPKETHSENTRLLIKQDEADRIKIKISFASGHSRFVKYKVILFSGTKICGKVKDILDFYSIHDIIPAELIRSRRNQELLKRLSNLGLDLSDEAKRIFSKHLK